MTENQLEICRDYDCVGRFVGIGPLLIFALKVSAPMVPVIKRGDIFYGVTDRGHFANVDYRSIQKMTLPEALEVLP